MVRGTARVLPRRIEAIHLRLEPRVRVRVREETHKERRERGRGGVRARDDREDAVVDELRKRRGARWVVLAVLCAREGGRQRLWVYSGKGREPTR